MLRKLVKYIQEKSLKPLLMWYLRKDRTYKFEGITLVVFKDIFHPLFFYSTMILIRHLKKFDLRNKSLLEPGCGSGLISVWAAKKGALVTAFDINPVAVENTLINAEKNKVVVQTLVSDLFINLPEFKYDFILINPPYYRGKPLNGSQYAWYCGNDYEYFENLFKKLPDYSKLNNETIMVLSQDCDLQMIQTIALRNNLNMQLISSIRSLLEKNYLYKISCR